MFNSTSSMFDATPTGKISAEEGGRSSDSEKASEHSSDIQVHTADKQDLMVSVRECMTEDGARQMQLFVSNLRPETALSKVQGDHVTAYQCLLEMLMVAVEGQPLRLCANVIAETAKSILPDKAAMFDHVLASLIVEIDAILTPEERHEWVGPKEQQDAKKSRLDHSLKVARRATFRQLVEHMGETFIREVNLDEQTAFARIGIMDRTQGARVKKAIHSLKAINDITSLIEKLSRTATSEADQGPLEDFYNRYIKTHAPYKGGANYVFSQQKITQLNDQWVNYNDVDKMVALQALHNKLIETGNFVKIIGSCFGNLFDFKYEIHAAETAVAGTLFQVIAKHIIVMFRAFPLLQSMGPNERMRIIDEFLETGVLIDQAWSQLPILREGAATPLNLALVKAEVLKLISPGSYRLLSSDERTARDALMLIGKGSMAIPNF